MSSHFELIHCGRELVVRHLTDRSTPNGVCRVSVALFTVIVPKRVDANLGFFDISLQDYRTGNLRTINLFDPYKYSNRF
jgi:hypothetical protein